MLQCYALQVDLILIYIYSQSKGLVKWDEKIISFKPDTSFQNTITLGSVSGNYEFKNFVMKLTKNYLF